MPCEILEPKTQTQEIALPSVPPPSLDTMHQPGIFPPVITPSGQEVLPWTWGVHQKLPGFSHEEIKEQLADALEQNNLFSEAENVRACQREFVVVPCSYCGLLVAFEKHCHNRLCPSCSGAAAELLLSEHEHVLKLVHYPRMVTLTWPSCKHLTREVFVRARKDLVKLRHSKVWASVWGGIGSFEVTWSRQHGWHLHWHAVIGSSYILQSDLSRVWERITGAPVVDIRRIKNDDKWAGIREVVKYPAKSADFLDNPVLVKEFLVATKGLKLVTGFGALYRVRVKKHGDKKLVCPRCESTQFDWHHAFQVARERVKRYGDGYVLNKNWSRDGPG